MQLFRTQSLMFFGHILHLHPVLLRVHITKPSKWKLRPWELVKPTQAPPMGATAPAAQMTLYMVKVLAVFFFFFPVKVFFFNLQNSFPTKFLFEELLEQQKKYVGFLCIISAFMSTITLYV